MKIGILGGTGRMGTGLARGYAQAGHEVILGSRDADKAKDAAAQIGGSVRGGTLAEAAQAGEIIVLSVPFREAANTVRALQNALTGKIIVDITNPFGAVPPDSSGMAENMKAAPHARWVAAYKTNFWKTLDAPMLPSGVRRDILVCGDDEDAKRVVMQLIEAPGFRAVDCGGLSNARTLDLMVPLMIELDRRYGGNALSSWKFMEGGM
ncbi:MAG: NADPH-dependent F420 reductase [Abditibacteriales bacterium]|nr:NADPH-dependent F420 reductase [Abditibacteriales bacterium]MDW8366503.1 NADPH-dependent F420 reductase [Abditibacteriales bacterium]